MVLIAVVMTIVLVVQQLMRLALVDVPLIQTAVAVLLWIRPEPGMGSTLVRTVFAHAASASSRTGEHRELMA